MRDGKVYVRDFGSTNGTQVNEDLIKDAEIAIEDGASIKIGPLDFVIRIELAAPKPDGTPLPSANSEAMAALAAVKAVTAAAKAPVRDATPSPVRAGKPGESREVPRWSDRRRSQALDGIQGGQAPGRAVQERRPRQHPLP